MRVRSALPRITILTADSGGGHRAAAASLTEAFEGRACVSCISLLDAHAPYPFNRWSAAYGPLVSRAPRLYALFYRFAGDRQRMLLATRSVYPLLRERLMRALEAEGPDLVISVHPLQVDIPLRALRDAGLSAPFMTVVTDPVTASAAWFCPAVDRCMVATDAAARLAYAAGTPVDRVRVVGLPIRRAFVAARNLARPQARACLGLEPGRPLVLLAGGGAGIGRMLRLADALSSALDSHPARPQMAIIAGNNASLQRTLESRAFRLPVTVLGFVDNMAEWMAASDLLVTKAGPGTLAEAACVGLPTLITDFVPGQESGNIDWVVRAGAGVYEPDLRRLREQVAVFLLPENPALARMAVAARSAAQPHAAGDIAGEGLALIERAP